MTVAQPQWPAFPALFRTVPAGAGKRVLRGVLSIVATAALALGAAALMVRSSGRTDLPPVTLAAVWGVAGVAIGVIFTLWGALAGGWLPDLIVGTRLVRVSDGRRAFSAGLGRSLLVGAFGLVTVGIGPLLVTLLTRDAEGRVWLDRLTGTALLDVRAGRNVLTDPVSQAELEAHFAPKPAPRPAIIQVRPGQSSYLPPLGNSAGPRRVPTEISTVADKSGSQGAGVASGVTRVSAPIVPRPIAPASAPAGGAVWLLAFDTGEHHLLHGSALIGRQPAARQSHRGAELVRISDPSCTVSSTHLAVTANDVGVWVEDLGSTNGSEVRAPNGRTQALAVHVRTAVAGGSRVRLGDRWMTVERTGS